MAEARTRLEQRLGVLAEVIQSFAASLDLRETLRHAIVTFIEYMDAEAASIFLLEKEEAELVCQQCAGPVDITGLRIPANQGIVGKTVREQRCQMVRDVQKDAAFMAAVDAGTGFVTRSILCAPLTVRGQNLGALELINKKSGDGLFNSEDEHILIALAAAAALAIHNARIAEALVEGERMRKELELVREVQVNLLPKVAEGALPVVAINFPAREVSGDFYDYFALPDGRIHFNLADVSGKGMNTALWMAKTGGLLRCLAKTTPDLSALVAQVNDEICETASHGMFVTLVVGVLDLSGDTVTLVNAGHLPVLYRSRDGEFREIPAEGPPVGVLPGAEFPVSRLALDGGSLYLYSDGVTEALDEQGRPLETAGLIELIKQHAGLAPRARMEELVGTVRRMGQKQRDDITFMLIDRLAGAAMSNPLLEMRFHSNPAELKEVRERVRGVVGRSGCGQELADSLVLAVNEACMNVIQHAYRGDRSGEIILEILNNGRELEFEVRDFAAPVDIDNIKPRDLDDLRPGGLGTHFIQSIMDEWVYGHLSAECGNYLKMKKKIG